MDERENKDKTVDEMKKEALQIMKPMRKGISVVNTRRINDGLLVELNSQKDLDEVLENYEFDANNYCVREAQIRYQKNKAQRL